MPSMRLLIELLDSASECCVYAWLSWLVILKQLVQLRVRKLGSKRGALRKKRRCPAGSSFALAPAGHRSQRTPPAVSLGFRLSPHAVSLGQAAALAPRLKASCERWRNN